MCIAMVVTPGAQLRDEVLWRGWTNNPHGGGFACVDGFGKVSVRKGLMKYNDFQTALRKALELYGKDSPFLVHMRYATQGTVDRANTHPFSFSPQEGPGGAYIHNGTMFKPAGKWEGEPGKTRSDSRVFGAVLNNILSKDVVIAAKKDLERVLTARNRIAFLYDDKTYVILNEGQGFWDKGIWFSNHSCTYSARSR